MFHQIMPYIYFTTTLFLLVFSPGLFFFSCFNFFLNIKLLAENKKRQQPPVSFCLTRQARNNCQVIHLCKKVARQKLSGHEFRFNEHGKNVTRCSVTRWLIHFSPLHQQGRSCSFLAWICFLFFLISGLSSGLSQSLFHMSMPHFAFK